MISHAAEVRDQAGMLRKVMLGSGGLNLKVKARVV